MKKSLLSEGIFPSRWAWTLLIPFRKFIFSPKTLLSRLHLTEDSRVLELGCGPGFFTITVAKALRYGLLIAADIQKEMIRKVEKRIKRAGIKNTVAFPLDGKILPFDNSYFDCIFLVTVLGEVENKEEYFHEFKRILKPDGMISISEQWGDSDHMEKYEIIRLFKKYNFKLTENFGGEKTFTLNFKRYD